MSTRSPIGSVLSGLLGFLGTPCALDEPSPSALAMALRAVSLLTQRCLIDDIERYRGEAKLILDSGGVQRPSVRMRMHRRTAAALNPIAPLEETRRPC
jgi:hypothetical protein